MKTSVIFSIIALALTININAENPNKRLSVPSVNLDASFLAYLNENDYEEERTDLADWMLDIEAFETIEELLEVETWMLDIEAFSEPIMEVEAWMLDETLFEESENFIEIEDWMLNPEIFHNEEDYNEEIIEIEDWMLNVDAFRK